MARQSPTELYNKALHMYCHGYSVEEIADELAVHRDSLRHWLAAPVYPSLRGRRLREGSSAGAEPWALALPSAP